MAKIRMIGYIAEISGFREKTVVIERPVQLKDLLPEKVAQKRTIILVNGLPASMDSRIEGEDQIVIMPVVGGG